MIVVEFLQQSRTTVPRGYDHAEFFDQVDDVQRTRFVCVVCEPCSGLANTSESAWPNAARTPDRSSLWNRSTGEPSWILGLVSGFSSAISGGLSID